MCYDILDITCYSDMSKPCGIWKFTFHYYIRLIRKIIAMDPLV